MNLLEVFQRSLKRFGLSDIAGQYLAAAGKALLIQNQCQGNQGTVISTLFRAPEAPKSLIVVLARTMGVRQVIEDDCCRNIQQVPLPAKQGVRFSCRSSRACRHSRSHPTDLTSVCFMVSRSTVTTEPVASLSPFKSRARNRLTTDCAALSTCFGNSKQEICPCWIASTR